MSRRGFLSLKDDDFWGHDESNTEPNDEDEERTERKKGNCSTIVEKVEAPVEGVQEELRKCVEKVEIDEWEAVGRKLVKKNDEKFESGNLFHHNCLFGGFSGTNALPYYQPQKAKRYGRFPPRRLNSSCEDLNVNWRDKCIHRARAQNEQSTPGDNNNGGEEKEKLEKFERDSISLLNSGTTDAEQPGDRPGGVQNPNELPCVNMTEEEYAAYYEYFCHGIRKLLESGATLTTDCDLRDNSPSSTCSALDPKYYQQYNSGPEIYSRKVFVGGLPIDIEEDELIEIFNRFGPLGVDWPNKSESKCNYKPKGYAFLIFDREASVRKLVESCTTDDEKLFYFINTPFDTEKLRVQIRPWRLADADYLVDVNIPINLRRVVFVGGVPRPIRAVELAHIMDRMYGSVACAGIDTDVEYKYPKGAGRVAFTNYNSYIKAVKDRYVQLTHGEIDKKVEIKPYVLDDQLCDECIDEKNGGKHAPFFCPHLECLQYYCESCWTAMHGSPSREHHKPLIKEA